MPPGGDPKPGASRQFAINPDMATALDFVRAVSAQLVLLGHAVLLFEVFPFLAYPHVPRFERVGVVVFFILSGMLISHSTMLKARNPNYSFKVFFIDRFSRIYSGLVPGLLFILAADLIIMYVLSTPEDYYLSDWVSFRNFFGSLFMLQDHPILLWLGKTFDKPALLVDHLGSGATLWSLSVEWWFYMFFGWVFLGWTLSKRHRVIYVALFLLLAVVPLYYLFEGKSGDRVMSYIWFAGVVMTIFYNRMPAKAVSPFSSALLSLVFFGMLLFYLKHYASNQVYMLKSGTLIACSMFFFFLIFRNTNFIPSWAAKVVRFFADSSYTLYLIHYTVCVFLVQFRDQFPDTWLFASALVLSNLASFGLAYVGEMQHKKLNRAIKKRVGVYVTPVSTRPAQSSAPPA